MKKEITVKNKTFTLPMYLPDATRAVVKGIVTEDLLNIGIEGVVVNTYHLMTQPGHIELADIGGVHEFMHFPRLIVSDSGGWQVFSLIYRNNTGGSITDEGVTFEIGGGSADVFTPEQSIVVQMNLGSDVVICLDDFTAPAADPDRMIESVERTVLWAKESKEVFMRECGARGLSEEDRPLIFAVIQGGLDKDLRKKCAEQLIEIGFDGYGFGGYVIDDKGNLDLDIAAFIADLIPKDAYRFALGVGKPWDIAACSRVGWEIFDCTLPTRDGRHGRLYSFAKEPMSIQDLADKDTYEYIAVKRGMYADDHTPLGPSSNPVGHYTRAYLNHLFRIGDTSAYRIATIHNLWVYQTVINKLRDYSSV